MCLVGKQKQTKTEADWKYDRSCGLQQGKVLRSGVHITSPPDWARDLSSGAPGVGALLGEQGCTREGGWQAVTSAAQNGRHAGARTGHEAAGLPDRPARARLALPSSPAPFDYRHVAVRILLSRGGAFRSSRNRRCRMNPAGPPSSSSQEPGANIQSAGRTSPTNDSSCYSPIPHHFRNLNSDGWVSSA